MAIRSGICMAAASISVSQLFCRMDMPQQQQYERPGSAAGTHPTGQSNQAWEEQAAELQQLKAELAAAQNRVREAGEFALHAVQRNPHSECAPGQQKSQDYAFCRQFSEKLSTISGCPGCTRAIIVAKALLSRKRIVCW